MRTSGWSIIFWIEVFGSSICHCLVLTVIVHGDRRACLIFLHIRAWLTKRANGRVVKLSYKTVFKVLLRSFNALITSVKYVAFSADDAKWRTHLSMRLAIALEIKKMTFLVV